ncbi:MAG TPA: FlgD immunoglobulin-like domain containing protein [Calditrichia bacterium]|nr:T9SS type A sorting domain-containing protein [Calditrichota bacterium]HQU70931.1 FlgD immunoglobulin-like domain containing protein [Calditrichia bacterium]HQV32317.1 FlgD immunoglobulin-like domain containing protein [Calditrichia bacterium]
MQEQVRKLFWLGLMGLFALQPAMSQAPSLNPKKLLIYYGWPSAINSTFTVPLAAAEFARYDYVVLGDGLEKSSHGDHQNTVGIIDSLHSWGGTAVFGYIDLGVLTQNLPLTEIETRVDEWLQSGADGIFFDDFGYDFQVSRERQNAAVDYAHNAGLPVIANGWNPDHLFGTAVDPDYNPGGAAASLDNRDFYLSESYQIAIGAYQSEGDWYFKAEMLKAYQDNIGFKILSITTNDAANSYDENKFFYAWHSALMYGHEATGWGEYGFSASSASAPYRDRPAVDGGTLFLNLVQNNSPVFERDTDAGRLSIDLSAHTYSFTPGVTAIGNLPGQPQRFELGANYPNPFNPSTEIRFFLPHSSEIRLEIFDLLGRRISTLAAGTYSPGEHRIRWDGHNASGIPVASGTYFYRLSDGLGNAQTLRMSLLR